MRHDIDSVDQKRRRLAAMGKRQLIQLVAELWDSVEALTVNTDNSKGSASGAKDRKKIGLSLTKAWTQILRQLRTYKHFRSIDIILVSRELQREDKINRIQNYGSARAQLYHLTKRGIIQRLGGGNYRVTDQTKKALGS